MITELILNGLFSITDFFLGLMPAIEWTVDTTAWQYAGDVLSMICWLLPFNTITSIFAAVIAIGAFRLTIAAIRTLAGLFPFLG